MFQEPQKYWELSSDSTTHDHYCSLSKKGSFESGGGPDSNNTGTEG